MKDQQITVFIALSTLGLCAFIFLFFIFYLFTKKINEKNKNKRKIENKIVQFNKFIIHLKNSLDFFSKKKVGALIILKDKKDITSSFLNNGVFLDAEFSDNLLKNIFSCKRSQLHDGATIIEPNYRISYASVIFTVPKMKRPIEGFGARHNVARSIVNKSNIVSIVVSEISGNISVFTNKTETIQIRKGKKIKSNYENLEKIIVKWKNEK